MQSGAIHGFISKPFHLDEVHRAMQNAMALT
jgi:hypothetical protein